MRQNGLEAAVLKLADRQVPVWGICGGYQMMGERLKDSQGVESDTAGQGGRTRLVQTRIRVARKRRG